MNRAGTVSPRGSLPPSRHDVLILGAGAAGLMCAAACGRRGRSVLVLDHADRTASKVRISGGGRCNFTNLSAAAEHYRSRNPHFARSALARFTPRRMLDLAAGQGIAYYEKEAGQIFCRKSSREIVGLLERQCRQAGAEILTGTRITGIRKERSFQVMTDRALFTADSLVIATGGLSYANLGASGIGFEIARQFGLAVVPPRPALVPLVLSAAEQRRFRACAGISIDAVVFCGGREFRGNILFTHRGLSGPAMLQASLYWNPAEPVEIDLLPDLPGSEVFQARRESRMALGNVLAAYLPKRFVLAWIGEAFAKPLAAWPNRELRGLSERLHRWRIVPSGTEGYRTAEVTAGGVDTDELSSKTLEARKVPGLYFIGEVVDVTGELGGYNLHWAWASAHAAGERA